MNEKELGNDLNKDDLNLLKKKTNIKQNVILEYYEKFRNQFPSGQVNREQFETLIKNLIIVNFNVTNEDLVDTKEIESKKLDMCERLWKICDQDQNGYIDFKEYLVLFWTRLSGDETEKLSLIFDVFDENLSGYLDFHEIHSIVKIIFKLKFSEDCNDNKSHQSSLLYISDLPQSYYVSMNIMKTFDTDRNAKLSRAEFITGCLNHENIRHFLTPLKFI